MCSSCGKVLLDGCDQRGRVAFGSPLPFMPRAYRQCPQFTEAGGIAKTNSAEVGLETTKKSRMFRFDSGTDQDFSVVIDQDPLRYISSLDGTGSVVWGASFVISDFLIRVGIPGIPSTMSGDPSISLRGLRVIELGAGLGLCSVVCAKLGATEVVATDGSADLAALIDRNAEANGVKSKVHARVLDWSDLSGAEALGSADVIIMADVAYEGNRANWTDLVRMVTFLTSRKSQSNAEPVLVWAHADRGDASRFSSSVFQSELFAPLKENFEINQVGSADLHPAYQKSNVRLFVLKRRILA